MKNAFESDIVQQNICCYENDAILISQSKSVSCDLLTSMILKSAYSRYFSTLNAGDQR